MSDLERLAVNQVTTREQWDFRQSVEGYARHGVRGISVWRDKLQAVGTGEAARMLRDHGMTVTGYCMGGLFGEAVDERAFAERLDDNRRVVDEAAEIGARCVVFVGGGLPEGSRDLAAARARTLEGLERLLPHARAAGVTLGLEPLHPMVCATRSTLATLGQANDWYEALDAADALGIVVDVYAVWWDPDVERQIERAAGRICAFHVSDWLRDTRDLRLDRGMMGDGCIDIRGLRERVEAAGYDGLHEVEIFSARNWWRRDPDEVVEVIKERFEAHV